MSVTSCVVVVAFSSAVGGSFRRLSGFFPWFLWGMSCWLGVIGCCLAPGLWEGLPCYAVDSLIVVWLVLGMWAVSSILCCCFWWLFASG